MLYHFSRTQKIVEGANDIDEWYGVTMVAAESPSLVELLQRLGFEIPLTVKFDSSVAKGKLALMELRRADEAKGSLSQGRLPWIGIPPKMIEEKRLSISKVDGSTNPSVVGTKAYRVEALTNLKCLGMMKSSSAM